jgi:hypothetical protein
MALFQTIGAALCVVVACILVASVWFHLTPERHLDILVYDQTVPSSDLSQHAALEQILQYHRVDYDNEDYIGLTPGDWTPHGTWPLDRPDLIVLADVNGVTVDEGGQVDPSGGRQVAGHLTPRQADDIAGWIGAGTPAWGEFALFTEPTPAPAAAVLEKAFGVASTGWRLRFFDDLAQVSPNIASLGAFPWPYEGPGMIAVSGPSGGRNQPRQLVVLTADQLTSGTIDLRGGPPGGGQGAAYDGWVAVVEPREGASVDATFQLPLTDDGRRLLARVGIPDRMPALIRTERTLYFAGDGLSNETPFRLNHLRGGAALTRSITGEEFQFLYQVLEPSFGWLLARTSDDPRPEPGSPG